MAASPVVLYPAAASRVFVGGTAVVAMYAPLANGGVITNPDNAADQGLNRVEVLYVDCSGADATLFESATTAAIQPGQSFIVSAGQAVNVSVNAATSGHLFSAYVGQGPTPTPPEPQPGTFPPSGPTTLTATIAAYLYQEYADDDDLQAFFAAYNGMAQVYASWFATVPLAAYTNAAITGALLDWVAAGLYGFTRPSLGTGLNRDLGPLNTYAYNTLQYNERKLVGPNNVTVTSDDVFKRIITWNFYKGDGNIFSISWLKRRIIRFLLGDDGSAPNIDSTYDISVTTGPGIIAIQISVGTRTVLGGALPNRFGFNQNGRPYNALITQFNPNTNPFAFATIFKEAMDAGVLQMPFQYEVAVTV